MRERLGSPRARLFLALDLPDRARGELSAWRDRAIADRGDLRAVAADALHVTLVFLGHRPEKEVPAIAGTAFQALAGAPPVRLAAGALVAVPPRRPRLFALELVDERGGAAAAQSAASTALAEGGFYRPEKWPFWPHVTFARVKSGRRAPPLEARAPQLAAFEAADIVLYRSVLRPEGARYEALERLRLGPGEGL